MENQFKKAEVKLIINEGQEDKRGETAATDRSGEFVFSGIPAGEAALKVSKAGFVTAEEKIKIERGKDNKTEAGIKEEGV